MKKLIIAGFCLIGFGAQGQSLERSVTATSGNYFYQTGTGSLSFTVGENAVTTFIAPGNILTQGFQQPDTSEITFVLENDVPLSITIFPNPVSNFLSCNISGTRKFCFVIYDETGRRVSVPLTSSEQQLIFDVHSLVAGYYTLTINETSGKFQLSRKFIKL
jgi:Secretion system C-terminal sorting domain